MDMMIVESENYQNNVGRAETTVWKIGKLKTGRT